MTPKKFSVWGTEDVKVYGVLFDPSEDGTACVFDVERMGNITSVKTDTLTMPIAQFYDFEIFTDYMNYIINKKKE